MNPFLELYRDCRLCPRECGSDRLAGETGFCGETSELRVSIAGLHFGEEPPLSGNGGSGTIFVTGCAMGCPFCQNHQISRSGMGQVVGENEFVEIARTLAEAGAENLNLVTPSHMAPTLAAYLRASAAAGIHLPVAWNSSGYESPESLSLLSELVNIWLPDLKTLDEDVASRRYGLADYPRAAKTALLKMADSGSVDIDSNGRMIRGLMARHLVLPGELESTRTVLEWFAENLKGRAWLSLMAQYTPVRIPGELRDIPERQLNEDEYSMILGWLDEYGIEDGFVQDLVPGTDWLPDFRNANPFSSDLSKIVWRWNAGFVTE